MDGSGGRHLPLEWLHPGPYYGYDLYTNSLVLLPVYGYGFGVDQYSWNPPYQHEGYMHNFSAYSSSSLPLLGRRPRLAAAPRGRGRGRGGRSMRQPRQHGGPGILGSDPSSQQPPQLPPPRRSPPDEPSSSQAPAQVQPPPFPVPLHPENKDPTPPPPPASPSPPSSQAITPPVSDPVKDAHGGVDGSKTADAKMDDSHDDVVVGLSKASSTAATDRKRLLSLDPPAPPMKNADVDVSMAHRDDDQGDVLGLNLYMAQKRLIKADPLAADTDAEEEAKAAARNKKTRLGWGQGLAKFENRYKKDDENTTHKLVAHDGATGQPASSHGSSPSPGSKNHGDDNNLDDMAEMRVSHVATVPALFSKGSSRPLTGDLGNLGKSGSISSMTESPADEVPAGFSGKHSPSPAGDLGNLGKSGSISSLTESSADQVPAGLSGKHSPSPEGSKSHGDDKNLDDMAEMRVSHVTTAPALFSKGSSRPLTGDLGNLGKSGSISSLTESPADQVPAGSSGKHSPSPADESSMEFTKVENIRPRMEKLIVKMVQRPRKIQKVNVFSDEEPETNENDVAPLVPGIATVTATKSVLIENHGDQGNCVAGASLGAKTANGTLKDDQVRIGANKTLDLSSSLKEWNHAAKHNSWKATEKNLANSNIGDGTMASSDMKKPDSKDKPCNTSDPAAMLTGLQFRCSMTSQKGKGIMSSPEVNDFNEPPMQISNEAPKSYHLPSSSSYASLDNIVDANSSYVAMDIDLNTPLDVSIVDLVNSSSEATDCDATMEISPSQTTTTTVTQTSQQQPANQPGSVLLFGRVIYQAPSTGTINHTPNQRSQTVVPSSNVPFGEQASTVVSGTRPSVVSGTRQRGRGQVYPSRATSTSVWRGGVPSNQLGQQAVLSNRMLYGSSTNGASSSAALPLQPGTGSRALVNMVNQQRQQALANITAYNIMRGGVPAVPTSPHLTQGSSSGGAGIAVNFSALNSVPQQWTYPVMDKTIRLLAGLPSFYYPGAIPNQAPATAPNTMLTIGTSNGEGASTSNIRAAANTMLSIGTSNGEGASTSSNIRAPANTMLSLGINNGEGASTSNTRAPPPAAGRGRGGRARGRGGPNSWLSLHRSHQE